MKIPIDINILRLLVDCIEIQKDLHLLSKSKQTGARSIIKDTVHWGRSILNAQENFSAKLQKVENKYEL